MNIDTMLADLLKVEGGYVNDPRDRGGETKFGITRATALENGYSGFMLAMTKDQALDIYRNKYFHKPGFGLVFDVAPSVAAELFDTGVNMGPQVAAKFLQRSLNALNQEGKVYPDLTVDGQVGPTTVRALRALVAKRGQDETEDMLLKMLNCLQGARYIALAEDREANEAFVWGWFSNRVSLS